MSAEFRDWEVRLVDIALATLSLAARTLVSTLMPAASKRLRTAPLSTSRIRSILTKVLDTPAANATDSMNVICALLLNCCLFIGRETDIVTRYNATRSIVQLTPFREYRPSGHVVHELALVAPDTFEYIPAGHLVHAVDPDVLEYVPALQFVHDVVPN